MRNERGAKEATASRHAFHPLLIALPRGRAPHDAPRATHDSHVRLRVAGAMESAPKHGASALAGHVEWLEAQELLDELAEDQLTLSMKLACLRRAMGSTESHGRERAAVRTLGKCLRDLETVRDVLAAVQRAAVPRSVQPAFLPDAPLAEYLRGVYAWLFAVVRALEQLVLGLQALAPNYALHCWRIEEAKNFHFDELEDAIIEDLATLFAEAGNRDAVTELTASFEVLIACARGLEVRLDERFA
jgi:hypothetical protein